MNEPHETETQEAEETLTPLSESELEAAAGGYAAGDVDN